MIYAITRPNNPDAIVEMSNPIVALVEPIANESVGTVHDIISRAWDDAAGDEQLLVKTLQSKGFIVLGWNEVELAEPDNIEVSDEEE